jgi:hypothetical protein
MHVQWLHSVHTNEPEGHQPMGGLYRLRLHNYLGGHNPKGEDLLDAEIPIRWRVVFVQESCTEKGIFYANPLIHVDKNNVEELQPGLE